MGYCQPYFNTKQGDKTVMTFKQITKTDKNLKILGKFLDNGKFTSVRWKKKDGSIRIGAIKSVKGKVKMNVKGHYLLVKDTNARGFKGDKIQYRKINLLTIKAIKQGDRRIYL